MEKCDVKSEKGPFHTTQREVHIALFWVPIITWRETLMSCRWRCPHIPCSRTHLGGTHLDFQMGQHIYKSNSDGICSLHLNRTWETLVLIARAPENSGDVSASSSKNTGPQAVPSLLGPPWPLLLPAASTPGPSLPGPVESHDFRWLLIPGPTTSRPAGVLY